MAINYMGVDIFTDKHGKNYFAVDHQTYGPFDTYEHAQIAVDMHRTFRANAIRSAKTGGRIRITCEVDLNPGVTQAQFNAEVLRTIASAKWAVVYLATEQVETDRSIMIDQT